MLFGGAAISAAVVTAGAVIAHADSSKAGAAALPGGLRVENGSVERQAVPGATNTVRVTNGSTKAMTIAVTPRPWAQSSSGLVSPNRRSTLTTVGVSEHAFTLAPGATRNVTVTLKSAPRGYEYGALEIVGLPTDVAKRKGIVTGYRIVGALRYKSAKPTYALKLGSLKAKSGALTLNVRNSGNTADPISGSLLLKGALGTRQSSIKATRALPGKTVALTLLSKKLAAGRYTATVSLKQGSLRTSVKKTIRITRR